MAHRPLSHAQSVLVNRLAMPVGAFVILIAIGRHSDALLGQYALVMTYYFMMQMLPLLGLTPYLMREVAREPAHAGRYLTTVGAISMAGCVIVDAVALPLVHGLSYAPEVKHGIGILGLLIFPGILLFISEIIFMSVHRARPIALIAIAENLVRVGASVAVLFAGQGLEALLWVFFATRVGALAAYLHWMRRLGIVPRWEGFDSALMRRTVAVLPSFVAGTLLFALFSRIDFVVLSLHVPVEEVGYYAVAYRPFEIAIMLVTALLMAVFPWAARMHAHAPARFGSAARSVFLAFIGGLACIAIAGTLFSDEYVRLLFARQYPRPVLLSQLFMASMAIVGIDYVASGMLHAADRQREEMLAMLAGGIVQVVLLVALVPVYGPFGAFGAKMAGTLCQLSLKVARLHRAYGAILTLAQCAGLAFCALAFGLACWAVLDAHWLVRLAAALFMCLVVVPAAGVALGMLQPLRLLRFSRRGRPSGDVTRFGGLLDVAAADARADARRARSATSRGRPDRHLAAILAYRLSRWLLLNGRRRLAGVVSRGARIATGSTIDPSSPVAPGRGTP